ncbi:MAG TPA: FAD-dependent oxidoreductase [Solirubrobacteraceae bacterium]|nr:FAD-dependent oxidoreductase [Solirubrobacteraceae bacterium]
MSADFDLVVVGGGPAALAAARAYRGAGGGGAVAIVADEKRMPYRRPPLTKELMRNEISEDELPLEDEEWCGTQRVALVAGRAVALDHAAHEVALSGGRRLTYDRCLLATGAEPKRLPVPGSDDPAVRVLRSLDDLRELQARLRWGAEAVVIGSGFIGCEIAASLRRRGHPVSLISDESSPNCRRLGEAAGERIAGWLRDEGVTLYLEAPVAGIERYGHQLHIAVGTDDVAAPVVIMATGVAPRSELLAGELTLRDGAVPVDSTLATALPDVLAAGDVCFAHNEAAGRPLHVEHWGDALGQGEIAGMTAAGRRAAWADVPGFWSTIGGRTLKYAAWGDGYDEARIEDGDDGAFSLWYGRDGQTVGVLAHNRDADYERGRDLIAQGARWS